MSCLALTVSSAASAQLGEATAEAAAPAAGLVTNTPALPLAARMEALEALASGELPKVPLEQLLEVSLDDDSSMVERDDHLKRVRRDTLVAMRQARRFNTKTEAELSDMEAQILAIDLERKVLALPIEVRERLVSLDGSRDESSEQHAAVQAAPARTEQTEPGAAAAHEPAAQASAKEPQAQALTSKRPRGFVYDLLVSLAWLLALVVPLWLVRRRTGEISEAYLAVHSEGALAASLRAHRERWFGFAPALVAAAVLAPSMLTRRPQRLALSFERSRDTLGHGSHERVERQAEQGASVVHGDAPKLPPAVLDAFTLEPVCEESPLLVERFPGLDAFRERFDAWRRREQAEASLVLGRAGFGKTTWLHAAARFGDGVPVSHLSLRTRATDPAAVRRELARAAGLSEDAAATTESLCSALLKTPRRLIWIDDLQQWFLRRPGGLEGLRELERVIIASGSHVCWVASMSHYTHGFVQWATRSSGAFRHLVQLGPWSQSEIEDLLSRRIAQSGFQVRYHEVALDQLDRVAGTAADYGRVICARAGGSPRAAIALSLANLHRQDDASLSMRLSRAPAPSELDGLSDVAQFALGGVAWHGRIAAADLAETLRVPHDELRLELDPLRSRGVLVDDADQLEITARWWPAVTVHLERKRLVAG